MIADRTAKAVSHYWQTRAAQRKKQVAGGRADQGLRSAVTGGAQMDGFIDLFTELVTLAGIPKTVFQKRAVELPGSSDHQRVGSSRCPREDIDRCCRSKSQVGPSFGNNFNNRTEEAIGSAIDLWTAFRERHTLTVHTFSRVFFMLEDCQHPIGP